MLCNLVFYDRDGVGASCNINIGGGEGGQIVTTLQHVFVFLCHLQNNLPTKTIDDGIGDDPFPHHRSGCNNASNIKIYKIVEDLYIFSWSAINGPCSTFASYPQLYNSTLYLILKWKRNLNFWW